MVSLGQVPLAPELESQATRAKKALEESDSSAALHSVDVTLREGTLVISGEVTSYYLKQVAQEIARRFADQGKLVNEVTVR